MSEARLAVRRLVQRPGATAASIVTLACGIGAAAATWSMLSAVLLRPLPVVEPDRLVSVGTWRSVPRGREARQDDLVYTDYPLIRRSGIFEDVAAIWGQPLSLLVTTGGFPQPARIVFVTRNFFDLLGVKIALGRGFTPEDDRRGAPLTAILSDASWRGTFNGEPAALGRSITVSGRPVTIVGVSPRGFRGLDLATAPALYMPLGTIADVGAPSTNYFAEAHHASSPTAGVRVVGRLSAGEPGDQALARLSALPRPARQRAAEFGLTPVNIGAVPAAARRGMAQFARMLGATVALLLLIGCSSVGMLLLVRSEARREELTVCLALGASRARLARGIALEGSILAVAGAALSLPVASWMFAGIRAFELPGGVSVALLDLSIDRRVVLAGAAAAIGASLVIAVIAGAVGLSADAAEALRARTGATPRTTRRRTRAALVGGQVAVALVLVAGAGLFARSLGAAMDLNPGFETRRIVSGSVSLRSHGYSAVRTETFFGELRARIASSPAVRSVAVTASQGGFGGAQFLVDGHSRRVASVDFVAIDDAYFHTLGIAAVAGRVFAADDTARSPLVGIASESLARILGDGASAVGRRVTMPFRLPPAPPPVIEIVGVVPDLIASVTRLEPAVLYLPMAQSAPGEARTIVVRAASDADAARRAVHSAVRQLDPAVTPGALLTLAERLATQMGPQRFGMTILGALGSFAVLLTALGIYVLAESMTVLRMRELGIRAALGANGRHLAAIVLAEAGRLVGLGLLAGLLLAWSGANTIRALLFLVQPLDPATLAGAAGLLLALALAASLRPALRAARVDLATVLRT
jgi:predicted permease